MRVLCLARGRTGSGTRPSPNGLLSALSTAKPGSRPRPDVAARACSQVPLEVGGLAGDVGLFERRDLVAGQLKV